LIHEGFIVKKKTLLLFLVIGLVCSCSGNDTEIVNTDIVGKWKWISTDGGFDLDIHTTPANTGKSYILELKKDYQYVLYENKSQIHKGTYNLFLKESVHSRDMERFIRNIFGTYSQPIVLNGRIQIISKNEFIISENTYDGIGSGFKRIE
jgi:hypothetical protein